MPRCRHGFTTGRAMVPRDGDIDRAVSHAIAAGDRDLAGEPDLGQRRRVRPYGSPRDRARLARQLHGRSACYSPALCLSRATRTPRRGQRWGGGAMDGDCARSARRTRDPRTRAIVVAARILRASGAAREGAVKMREDVQAGIELLASDSPWRPLCLLIDGRLASSVHRARRRATSLEEGVRTAARHHTLRRNALPFAARSACDRRGGHGRGRAPVADWRWRRLSTSASAIIRPRLWPSPCRLSSARAGAARKRRLLTRRPPSGSSPGSTR